MTLNHQNQSQSGHHNKAEAVIRFQCWRDNSAVSGPEIEEQIIKVSLYLAKFSRSEKQNASLNQ